MPPTGKVAGWSRACRSESNLGNMIGFFFPNGTHRIWAEGLPYRLNVCVTYQNILPDLSSGYKLVEKMKGTCIQQETLRLWANLTSLFLMFFERLRFSRVLVSCHLRRLGTNVQKHVRRASAVFIPSPFSHRKYMFTFTKNVFEWLWPECYIGFHHV